MAQMTLHQSGQDGRSVLGMVAVQVERDPKTGTTVVRSVAPVSTEIGAPLAETVFDDGRKSIHAVAGPGCPPSTEELGQILSAVDGVGMKVMLDEVTVTPKKAESQRIPADAHRTPVGETQCVISKDRESTGTEDVNATVVPDPTVKELNMEDRDLEESPITLVFLGYTSESQQEPDMLTAERVLITEDGDEQILGQQSEQEAVKGSNMRQNIPPKEKDPTARVQEDNGEESSPINTKEGKAPSKRKTCQCCSVM
ncbi:paralemmin-1-like [Nerophis ophidion]|uniref:paralemmin-1-like n=1 Tax=Nerophis ophidion TaxID=159077 RepID=UPI002ADF2A86|nr:paralemmin-1-like [Nerophis ophidion]XP_061741532.1 paralemmin-1-like [Nerophis ophidion]XP_061741533.1 paralemmin-1-like [Nerophis ophidion]XP_061741534.1 paralemmin-1-like [Nerophis ophidion]